MSTKKKVKPDPDIKFDTTGINTFFDEIEQQRATEQYQQQEITDLLEKFNRLNARLDDSARQLKLILEWFEEFEDFVHWLHMKGFWDAEDIDEKNPMRTYYNGLERFCREHNIKLK